ncbi:MAG: sel1 repeat family protein [Rhodanobacteraceae bacterium]
MHTKGLATRGLACVLLATSAPVFAQQYINPQDLGYTGPVAEARPGPRYFQQGVDAFKKGDPAFAIEMYRVAASWGYKKAEYNLGVMYAKGQGVPVDLPRAMAWMALAAERGDNNHFTAARNAIGLSLTDDQLARANVILRVLTPTYADAVALTRAKARWRDERRSATGSKVGFVGNLVVGAHAGVGSGQPIGSSNGDAPPPTDSQGRSTGASVGVTAFQLTGGRQMEGSLAYRQLWESDNPYDPKFNLGTGTATVGPLITGRDAEKADVDAPSNKSGKHEETSDKPDTRHDDG